MCLSQILDRSASAACYSSTPSSPLGKSPTVSYILLLYFPQLINRRNRSLELIVWLVPSLIGDGVAVSIVGVLLGPIYPIVMNESSRILPRWLLTGSIGWIAGFGQVRLFVGLISLFMKRV